MSWAFQEKQKCFRQISHMQYLTGVLQDVPAGHPHFCVASSFSFCQQFIAKPEWIFHSWKVVFQHPIYNVCLWKGIRRQGNLGSRSKSLVGNGSSFVNWPASRSRPQNLVKRGSRMFAKVFQIPKWEVWDGEEDCFQVSQSTSFWDIFFLQSLQLPMLPIWLLNLSKNMPKTQPNLPQE